MHKRRTLFKHLLISDSINVRMTKKLKRGMGEIIADFRSLPLSGIRSAYGQKNLGLNWDSNPDLCYSGTVLY